jgi:ABC-2 type transport system permease protein
MRRIAALFKKELLLLSRDIHALLVLFVVPALFIVIMSFALEGLFETAKRPALNMLIYDGAQSSQSRAFIDRLGAQEGIEILPVDAPQEALGRIEARGASLFLEIDEAFARKLGDPKRGAAATLHVDAAAPVQIRMQAQGVLQAALGAQRIAIVLDSFGLQLSANEPSMLQTEPVGRMEKMPTSVQQSVPAWLIFSMFFLVIPIANTFIMERQMGTLSRLALFNLSAPMMLLGKAGVFVLINMVQLAVMLLVGFFLIEALGGSPFEVNGSLWLLALVGLTVSLAAVFYALMIAALARTTEQATTIGGVLNIVLAALGGIMVPVFAMPGWMQTLSALSPMNWALEAFLDVVIRAAGVVELLPKLGVLLLFALTAAWVAYWRLAKTIRGELR